MAAAFEVTNFGEGNPELRFVGKQNLRQAIAIHGLPDFGQSICTLHYQEVSSMSDRFSNHHRKCSSDNRGSSATATALSPFVEQTSEPTLDSLLASCGALRSALRRDANAGPSDETNHSGDSNVELDACQTEVMECELSASVLNYTKELQADPSQQESIDSKFPITAMPADVATVSYTHLTLPTNREV